MIEHGSIVRFACLDCRTIFDVDLPAIARLSGASTSLFGAVARCKSSRCRGHGHFLFAPDLDSPFILLVTDPDRWTPSWLQGLTPMDVDAPDDPLPGAPAAARAVAGAR
jgi:hypothetical protein